MTRAPLHLALPALVACGSPEPTPADAPEDSAPASTGPPSAYTPELAEDDAGQAATPAELEEGLAEVVAYLDTLDPLPWHDLWDAVFWGERSADCPELQEHNGMDYWNDRCTTEAGVQYRGWTLQERGGGWTSGDGVTMNTFAWLSGHAVLTLADGTVLENFGDNMYQHAIEERGGGTVEVWQGFVYGDFFYSGADAASGWMQGPVTNETYYRYELQPDGSRTAMLDGALAWFDGPVVAARLTDVVMSNSRSACTTEPVGEVRLRDRSGAWTTVVFDGYREGDPTCDGCGVATRDGEDLGAVCADFTPLIDWTGARPWDG